MGDDHAYTNGKDCDEDEASEALARDRTDMAVERTFAGWIRTAFRVLFGELQPPWLAKAIGSMFIGFAIFLALNAQRRAEKSLARMRSHAADGPDAPRFRLLSWGVATGAAILIAGLWILNDGEIGG